MQNPRNMFFRREFSLTMFKNKKIRLSEMSFYKDFVTTTKGDLYPIFELSGDISEKIDGGRYHVRTDEKGSLLRFFTHHFPYASYEIVPEEFIGKIGISLVSEVRRADIFFTQKDNKLLCCCGRDTIDCKTEFKKGTSFIITCRKDCFDVYIKQNDYPNYVGSFCDENFEDIIFEKEFMTTAACLFVSGEAVISSCVSYIDCGVSQADIRPIKYQNGETIVENGKVFFTMSIRPQENCFQGIFSWIPGTSEFELTGALFFDCGDGAWRNYLASSVVYDREKKLWYIWTSSFNHKHILAHGISDTDFRFGVNVIDVEFMEEMSDGCDDTAFLGKKQDEDPDIIYDSVTKKWYMAICRIVTDNDGNENYRYFIFESDDPFTGFRHIAHATSGAETGGGFLKTDEGLFFICGNGYDKRAEYRIYKLPDMSEYTFMRCDLDDGGFRGWGCVFPVKKASRTKYYWLTFDRHGGSNWTWSYGNIYGFVSD